MHITAVIKHTRKILRYMRGTSTSMDKTERSSTGGVLCDRLIEYWESAIKVLDAVDIPVHDHLVSYLRDNHRKPSSYFRKRDGLPADYLSGLDTYLTSEDREAIIEKESEIAVGKSLAQAASASGWSVQSISIALHSHAIKGGVLLAFCDELTKLIRDSDDPKRPTRQAVAAYTEAFTQSWSRYIPGYARESYTKGIKASTKDLDAYSFWENDWSAIPIFLEKEELLRCLYQLDPAAVLEHIGTIRVPALSLLLIKACIGSDGEESYIEAIGLAPVVTNDEDSLSWNGSLVLLALVKSVFVTLKGDMEQGLYSYRSARKTRDSAEPEIQELVSDDAIIRLALALNARCDRRFMLPFLAVEFTYDLMSRTPKGVDRDIYSELYLHTSNLLIDFMKQNEYTYVCCSKMADARGDRRLALAGILCTARFVQDGEEANLGTFFTMFLGILLEMTDSDRIYIPNIVLMRSEFTNCIGGLLAHKSEPDRWVVSALESLSEARWMERFTPNPSGVIRAHAALFRIVRCTIEHLMELEQYEVAESLWNVVSNSAKALDVLYRDADVEGIIEHQILGMMSLKYRLLCSRREENPQRKFVSVLKEVSSDLLFHAKTLLWLDSGGVPIETIRAVSTELRRDSESLLNEFDEALALHPRSKQIYSERLGVLQARLEESSETQIEE